MWRGVAWRGVACRVACRVPFCAVSCVCICVVRSVCGACMAGLSVPTVCFYPILCLRVPSFFLAYHLPSVLSICAPNHRPRPSEQQIPVPKRNSTKNNMCTCVGQRMWTCMCARVCVRTCICYAVHARMCANALVPAWTCVCGQARPFACACVHVTECVWVHMYVHGIACPG